MIGVKLNNFNETSLGEPDQDANSALTELDKGLRSGKIGEQSEAIVRFPRLFEKYPFPILINSSFLKLADVFRMGNNFLRLWVLRVCQQSEKHLDKILNVDEFLRRIYSVLHSNDPVARGLALKTLGAVAGIIPERQNVHHAIRRALDSQDNVEVDAAIYATTQFAAHSNAFAISMCNKLSDMVESVNTGAERRDKLVRALRTVHGGAVRAHAVLKLLKSLLERFPSSSTVRASISALTAIANDTVVHVPDQVEVLLKIAVNDPRASIRRTALLSLKVLAQHAALWSSESIQALVLAASTRSDDTAHTMLCLDVMQILVKCPAVCVEAGSIQTNADGMVEPSLLRKFCSEATLSVNLKVASTAADVLTRIVVHCHEENLLVEGADLILSLESLVIATGLPSSQNNIRPLRIALRCLVQLSNAEPTIYADRTAKVLGCQLKICKWNEESTRSRLEAILEALGALGGMTYSPLSIRPALPAVIEKLNVVIQLAKEEADVEVMDTDSRSSTKPSSNSNMSLVLLCTVACQERAGYGLEAKLDGSWETQIRAAIAHADAWTKYRVARAALRYGHQQLASNILEELVAIAPSEATHRWLSALHRAASADATLIKEGINGLSVAAAAWERAGGAGGAGAAGGGACAAGCAGCGACGALGSGWMLARAAQLAALSGAAAAARALCTQPPPAIAHAHAQMSRVGCARAGACVPSVRRGARALAACALRYAHIASTAFHADDSTLRQLHISQHTCNLLAQFLEQVVSTNGLEQETIKLAFSGKELQPQNLEEKIMLNVCNKIEQISNTLFNDPATKAAVTHRHMAAVLRAIEWCSGGACWSRGAGAGRASGARCRVSLSLGSRQPDHHATLPLSHHLTLGIEGVLLPDVCLSKRQKQRQVKGVQLTVTATMHPRSNEKCIESPVLTAVQTVCPVRDFFSAQQLIQVPTPGMYCVAVHAALVDEKQKLWNTGPRTSLLVKAHEDPAGKSNSQTSRSRF